MLIWKIFFRCAFNLVQIEEFIALFLLSSYKIAYYSLSFIALLSIKSALGGIRTHNRRIRSPMRYPIALRGLDVAMKPSLCIKYLKPPQK